MGIQLQYLDLASYLWLPSGRKWRHNYFYIKQNFANFDFSKAKDLFNIKIGNIIAAIFFEHLLNRNKSTNLSNMKRIAAAVRKLFTKELTKEQKRGYSGWAPMDYKSPFFPKDDPRYAEFTEEYPNGAM